VKAFDKVAGWGVVAGWKTGERSVSLEQIWAPWRLGYILGEDKAPKPGPSGEMLPDADPDCFLCQCVPDGDDLGRVVLGRTQRTITVLNRYPYNNGHLLIAPLRHRNRLDQLSSAEQLELTGTMTHMVGLLEKVMRPDGFNIGLNLGRAAGAGLPGHLHWHIVPRWIGDTNFMPATAGVRVIPQSLEALWEMLREALAKP
jgi:ATP adenylyltransferase